MNETNQTKLLDEISQKCDVERAQYFFSEVAKRNEIWILTDEHGSVMLNTDEEDCVPVWPNKEFAQAWATDEWSDCKPDSISLNKWYSRWTQGLESDELALIVFPNIEEKGLVYFPDELEADLKKAQSKQKKHE